MFPTTTSFSIGSSHPDTRPPIDDRHTILAGKPPGSWKISSIKILHGKFCKGFQVFYKVQGSNQEITSGPHYGADSAGAQESVFQLADDEYLSQISGSGGSIVDRIEFHTTKGKVASFGGTGGNHFTWKAPYLHHFNLLVWACNGDLHNLHATPVPIENKIPGHPGANQYNVLSLRSGLKKSNLIGGNNPDSQYFDDHFDLLQFSNLQPEVKGVTVWHDHKQVIGLQAIYHTGEGTVTGGRHVGHESAKGPSQQIQITLDVGEKITEISGRGGNIVDHIRIATNKGKIIEAGGQGGNPFGNILTGHGTVRGFGGATNGHLHNLFVYES